MQSHKAFQNSTCQKDCDIINLDNEEGKYYHRHPIALLGILINSPLLYPPESFNGATIDDPWDTMHH